MPVYSHLTLDPANKSRRKEYIGRGGGYAWKVYRDPMSKKWWAVAKETSEGKQPFATPSFHQLEQMNDWLANINKETLDAEREAILVNIQKKHAKK